MKRRLKLVYCLLLLSSLGAEGCSRESPRVTAWSSDVGKVTPTDKAMINKKSVSITGQILTPEGELIVPAYARNQNELTSVGATVCVVKWPEGMELPPMPKEAVTMKFVDDRIVPDFQVVVVGQELTVTADDGRNHRLHCSSPEYSDPSPAYVDPMARTSRRRFRDPITLLILTCGAHVSESALVTVVPNSLFAVPDKKGTYRLAYSFPPGDYVIRAIAPKYGVLDKRVSVGEKETAVNIDFKFSK